ncbi:MAG: hypothetical protein IJW82_07945 [Clostridia bacterium]|nr:hypothetical protein [Clostridia bacterium]
MKREVVNEILSLIKNMYSQKELNPKGIISFLFARIIYVAVFAMIDFLILFSLHVFFKVRIERFFMLTIVILIELMILVFTNKEQEIKYNKNLSQDEKMDIFHYTNIFLFGYKNMLYNVYYVLPFLIAYGVFRDAGYMFYLNSVILVGIIPLTVGAMLVLLPKPKKKKTKLVLVLRGIIINIVTLFLWLVLYVGLKIDWVYTSVVFPIYSPKYTIYNNMSQILNVPITLDNFIRVDISNSLLMIVNLISKNIIELSFLTGLVYILFRVTIKVIKFIETRMIEKHSVTKEKTFAMRNYNTKVFRINHTLRNCMPRSPTRKI